MDVASGGDGGFLLVVAWVVGFVVVVVWEVGFWWVVGFVVIVGIVVASVA